MTTAKETQKIEEQVEALHPKLNALKTAVSSVVFGQDALIEQILMALLAGGHVLLEGLPGLGKTELVKTFSRALDISNNRVQFTPDLLPGDITGNPILQEVSGQRQFVFQEGPVFTHFLLADEINRASPKTQSALLEAMQEHSVTVMGQSHPLPRPFFVFATQNPIELEGTYPLPEAQLDRFLFKLDVARTSTETLEKIIEKRTLGSAPTVAQVMDKQTLTDASALTQSIFLPPAVSNYIARLVNATHDTTLSAAQHIQFGASPRAAIGLAAAAKASALIDGRAHASCEDVTPIARAVLRHRVVLNYQARMEGHTPDSVLQALLEAVPVEPKALPRGLSTAKVS